jgi:diaminopimelate epimerase
MKNHSLTFAFTKMHGLGNDFMVINTLNQSIDLKQLPITTLSDRHVGVGFDQLLLIEKSKQADFFCRIFNADGSEAEQCGNGLRCVARFIHENGLYAGSTFSLETKAGVFPIDINDYDHIRVTLAAPNHAAQSVELSLPNQLGNLTVNVLSLGNPHAVIKVASLESTPINLLGPAISTHPHFPQGTNVGFMQIINPNHVRLRTIERGSGETHACGSNACAAALTGIKNGWLQSPVKVEFHYGELLIDWDDTKHLIHMTGPAARVFSGNLT